MAVLGTIESLYTDGACSGNPGPGGWGAVAYFTDGRVHELGGADPETTNNRMELQAAIAALEFLQSTEQQESVVLYTDSEYVKNGITQWIRGWKKKDWKTSTGKPVLNQDLWEQLDRLHQAVNQQLDRPLQWRYVRGHTGNIGNERCDAIARAFSLGQVPTLTQSTPVNPDALGAEVKDLRRSEDFRLESHPEDFKHASLDTNVNVAKTIQSGDGHNSKFAASSTHSGQVMTDSLASASMDTFDTLPQEVRVAQLHSVMETLRIADEIAKQGYLITSAELADLMDVNASAVTSRGDNWVWRNWVVSRVRREGNQILWQLERVD